MGGPESLKKSRLSGFSWVLKSRIIVGEDMRDILSDHAVERFPASLWQNHGIGGNDGRQILFIRIPTGTKNVAVGLEAGMKRENHQYPNLRNALVSRVQFF